MIKDRATHYIKPFFVHTDLQSIVPRRPVDNTAWLMADQEQLTGKVIRLPQREDIQYSINEQLIVELYSR